MGLRESANCEYPLELTHEYGEKTEAKFAILCGGLHAARLTQWVEGAPPKSTPQMIALKVDYLKVAAKYCDHLSTNIYPVPDLGAPFLGAHFSPQTDGNVLLGPWAVPALKLEGYR